MGTPTVRPISNKRYARLNALRSSLLSLIRVESPFQYNSLLWKNEKLREEESESHSCCFFKQWAFISQSIKVFRRTGFLGSLQENFKFKFLVTCKVS